MKAAGQDFQRLVFASAVDAIYEAMFAGNTSRPKPLHLTTQRFGFSEPREWITHNVLDQGIYLFDIVPIGLLPVDVIEPCA